MRKHFALNSVALNVFALIFIMLVAHHMTGYMTSQEKSRTRES